MEDYKEEGISHDLREKAHVRRLNYFENIEFHLLTLESKLKEKRFSVEWASDEDRLCQVLTDCLPQQNYNRVCVASRSLPDNFLNQEDVIQSYSVDDVLNGGADVASLIVTADFAIAETGELVFLNHDVVACFNNIRNLIVLVNIDQVLIGRNDISLFSYLKGEGNGFSSSVTILQNPFDIIVPEDFQSSDAVGYSKETVEVKVIIYENNVSDILNNPLLRESLYCINCGRCSNACPVFQANSLFSPIDLVKANCFEEYSRTQMLFKHTTLCGNCQSVCPVNIPLMDLLVYEMGISSAKDKSAKNKALFSIFSKRSKMNKYNSRIFKWFFVNRFFRKNKVLKDYFNAQSGDFYNIARKDSEYIDE